MTIRVGKLNGKKLNYLDHDVSSLDYTILNSGIIEGMSVTTNTVAIGRALLQVTRTSVTPNQVFMVHVEITNPETISTSGTKKVWLEIDQSYINNGTLASNPLGTGIATVNTGASYPASNYIPLAGIVSGTITDERKMASFKPILAEGFPVGKTKYIDPTTGKEVVKNTNPVGVFSSSHVLSAIDPSTGNEVTAPYSSIEGLFIQGVSSIAGESFASGDIVIDEFLPKPFLVVTEAVNVATPGTENRYDRIPLGNVAGNTKRSVSLIGSGVSSNTLQLALDKVGTPTDNFIVRIETDDGTGKPSGTLVHANATGSISGSSLTTTLSTTTITFGGAFTIANGTNCHVVFSRSTVNDGSNYYRIGYFRISNRGYLNNNYNSSWGTASGTPSGGTVNAILACIYTGVHGLLEVKAVSPIYVPIKLIRSALETRTRGGSVKCSSPGVAFTTPGLTPLTQYFIGSTAGVLSTSSGSGIFVGMTDSSGVLIPNIGSASYNSLSLTATGFNISRTVAYTCHTACNFSWSKTGGASSTYESVTKNGTPVTASTPTVLYPGDFIQITALWGTSPTYTVTTEGAVPTLLAS